MSSEIPSNKQQRTTYKFISDIEGWTGIDNQVQTDRQDGWDGFGKVVLEPTAYYGKIDRNFGQFNDALMDFDPEPFKGLILGATIPELQAAMNDGQLTSVTLTKFYLWRIGHYDIDKLNSVMALNPNALFLAHAADEQRKQQSSIPALLGIPVLLKDNIATDDEMHTTGGMAALLDWQPDHDAHIVTRLREAGAVILGKANLSENANYFTSDHPNGFSNLGGQTRNPYGFYSVLGSSSGSAVAAGAEFAAITIGTETQGSINAPAEMSSVVGFKPSIGLVSRDNIIPLGMSQDCAGPMAKSVIDAAITCNVLVDADRRDPLYTEVKDLPTLDYTDCLNPEYYQGIKVGIYQQESSLHHTTWLADIKTALEQSGIAYEIVTTLPTTEDAPELDLNAEFKHQFAQLATAQKLPVASVAELVEFNSKAPLSRAVWGQDLIQSAAESPVLATKCLEQAEQKRKAWQDAVSDYFNDHNFDVLVTENTLSYIYAPAGVPSVSVPFGYETQDRSIACPWIEYFEGVESAIGAPVSAHVMAARFDDGKTLAIARAIELGRKSMVSRQHQAPDLAATLLINEQAGAFSVHDAQQEKAAK
ncbi:amidase family protein [Vibrio gallicus]|uniref:amidase family protein n=1 Tax=Vibrio gallicus TaxID=190897 RepID=UPI0021C305B2|nr:amidase family protein [Vibrio gallicus]